MSEYAQRLICRTIIDWSVILVFAMFFEWSVLALVFVYGAWCFYDGITAVDLRRGSK